MIAGKLFGGYGLYADGSHSIRVGSFDGPVQWTLQTRSCCHHSPCPHACYCCSIRVSSGLEESGEGAKKGVGNNGRGRCNEKSQI
jgi:hypothetical protein